MTNTNWARWDKQRRTELGVPAAAWLRQTDPTKTELYFEGSTTPLVAIVREADDRWCCTLPDQVVFTGSAEHARELMWKAAAAAPGTRGRWSW